jgi:EpsI family protein
MNTAARRTCYLLVAAGLVVLASLAAYLGQRVSPQALRAPLGELPTVLGPWRAVGLEGRLDRRTLDLLKPTSYLLRTYRGPRGWFCTLFVAYFALQKEGQIIHSPRNCLPGAGWEIQSRRLVKVPGGPWRVNHLVLANGLDRLSVVYWYQGRGRVEPDEYRDRLRLILDSVFLGRTDGTLVRLTTTMPRRGGEGILPAQLRMAAALIPAMARILPPAGRIQGKRE